MEPRTRSILSPGGIALGYLVFGCLWILFSDSLVEAFFTSPQALSSIQTVKGWFYVLVTGLALYLLLRARQRAVEGHLARKIASEARLQESESLSRTLVEQAGEAIYLMNPEGRVVKVNQRACAVTGYTSQELTGMHVARLDAGRLGPKEVRAILFDKPAGEPCVVESRHRRKDGTTFPVELTLTWIEGNPEVMVVALARDLTQRYRDEEEREQLEARIRQGQKMEALGALAGGIAHDFNNILAAIMGYAELAQMDAQKGEPNPQALQRVLESASRAKELVRKILTFSRQEEAQLGPVDLNREIVHIAELLRHSIPRMVDLELDLAPDLLPVQGDPGQLERVVVNLAANAVDAMPQGGRLAIATANLRLAAPDPEASLPAGDYVRLTVSDNGQGMDQETLRQAFEPFFTTKAEGKGTGLGLATVYGIVRGHEGRIHCDSSPGRGATFTVYLPAGRVAADQVADTEAAPKPLARGRGEMVLLVDDEKSLVEITSAFLEQAGYRCLTAGSGEEALEVYGKRGEEISLVVLDMSMPGMGGRECLRRLRALDPGVRVLISSGYGAPEPQAPAEGLGEEYLAKPFRAEALRAKVTSMLGGD